MTEHLDYLGGGGGEMEDVWFQVERRGDQLLPTELKMGTMKNILPMNYISESSDFITALISIPVTNLLYNSFISVGQKESAALMSHVCYFSEE